MLITVIFMLLLGTKLGDATTKTEVTYEGADRIKVAEEKDDTIVIPGIGSPPFAPAFFHQGSNFFFNPQIVMPGEIVPMGLMVEKPLKNAIFIEQEHKPVEVIIPEVTKVEPAPQMEVQIEQLYELPVAPELLPLVIPQIEVEEPILIEPAVEVEINRKPIEIPIAPELPELVLPELPLPIPPVKLLVEQPCANLETVVPEVPTLIEKLEAEIPLAPELPPLVLPILPLPNPPVQVIMEECDDIEISNNIIPEIPILIEEPCEPSGGLYISEVNVHVNEIPPPPELPPLIITEIPQPVIVETKNIILVPAAPEFTSFYQPSFMVTDKAPIMPIDCAQNIIFERVLPNLAVKNGQIVELISIPAKKRAPVVTSIML